MRTLVVSDLHLGGRLRHDALARPEPLRRLLAALDGLDRLILLGDIVELMEGRASQAMAVAEPVLRNMAARLAPGAEVVIVPGNHDLPLIRTYIRPRLRELTVETAIPVDVTRALSRVVSWLEPARVRVAYPGVWVSERVWATHGHYLDQHLFPESAFGISRGLPSRRPSNGVRPEDYERHLRPSLSRASRWMPRAGASAIEDAADVLRASTMPRVHDLLLSRRIAPLTTMLLGLQMRRASIPALVRVAQRLGVGADWVIFGHVHRLGPLADDDPGEWSGPDGRPRILNTGCWVYEPRLVHATAPPHPYWPGGAVEVASNHDPRAVGLLNDLTPGDMI